MNTKGPNDVIFHDNNTDQTDKAKEQQCNQDNQNLSRATNVKVKSFWINSSFLTSWLSLAISITTLFLAIWYSYFKPYNLILSPGPPLLVTQPLQSFYQNITIKSPDKDYYSIAFIIPIYFKNEGAVSGKIDDIVIEIESQNKNVIWKLQPIVEINNFSLDSWISGPKQTFTPIIIGKNEAFQKIYVFSHVLSNNMFLFKNRNDLASSDTWTIKYYVFENGEPREIENARQKFVFSTIQLAERMTTLPSEYNTRMALEKLGDIRNY